MRYLTLIHTLEPATGRFLVRPACELYRSLEQARRNVLRREYESGIPTWTVTMRHLPFHSERINALDEYF